MQTYCVAFCSKNKSLRFNGGKNSELCEIQTALLVLKITIVPPCGIRSISLKAIHESVLHTLSLYLAHYIFLYLSIAKVFFQILASVNIGWWFFTSFNGYSVILFYISFLFAYFWSYDYSVKKFRYWKYQRKRELADSLIWQPYLLFQSFAGISNLNSTLTCFYFFKCYIHNITFCF